MIYECVAIVRDGLTVLFFVVSIELTLDLFYTPLEYLYLVSTLDRVRALLLYGLITVNAYVYLYWVYDLYTSKGELKPVIAILLFSSTLLIQRNVHPWLIGNLDRLSDDP